MTATFQVHCDGGGAHEIDVSADVQPAGGETPDVPDPDLANNTQQDFVMMPFVLPADGQVSATVAVTSGAAPSTVGNSTVTVTADVTNAGPADGAGFMVGATLDVSGACAVVGAPEAEPITLDAGETTSVPLDFTVACTRAGEASFEATASLTPDESVVDADASNDTAVVSLTTRAVGPYAIVEASPSRIAAGSGDLTLTLTGDVLADFTDPAQGPLGVSWDGTLLDATAIDASHVQATVPADLVASAGGHYRHVDVRLGQSARGLLLNASDAVPVFVVGPAVEAVTGAPGALAGTTTVSLMPSGPDGAGIAAGVTDTGAPAPGGVAASDVWAAVATYSHNPIGGVAFGVDGGYVDLRVTGADPGDSATVRMYYPSSVTPAREGLLELWYFDGAAWQPVLGSGGAAPVMDTADNLDGTTSGGRFTVTLDATSTPSITSLTGTAFAMTVPDGTPPITTASVSGTAGRDGWYMAGDPVVVTLSAADDRSGVASTTVTVDGGSPADYAGPLTLTDGVHNLTFFSMDEAGNVEDAQTLEVKVDQSPPTITSTRTPDANANGWNVDDVSVTFTCSDDASGVASCDGDATVGAEGAGQSVTGTATDQAGNVATATAGDINVDRTPPDVTAAQSPAPNAAGWNRAPVTVTGAGTDALSGIDAASCTTVTLSDEGDAQSATVSCADEAGNVASATLDGIRVDLTAPVTTATVDGPVGDGGWYTGPVSVSLGAADALSGVASTEVNVDGAGWQPYDAPIALTADGSHSVQFRSSDLAGNIEAAQSVDVEIDQKAPATTASLAGTTGNDGWYIAGSPVVLTLTATDAASGVARTAYRVNGGDEQPYSGPVTFPDGVYSVAYFSVDAAGNVEPVRQLAFRVDQAAPQITISGVDAGGSYVVGGADPACEAADPGADASGLAGACDGVLSAPPTATGVGQYTYTVTASDVAGNTNQVTVAYSVTYGWGGFEPPLGKQAHFEVGQAVPLKFRLFDARHHAVDGAAVTVTVNGAPARLRNSGHVDGNGPAPDPGRGHGRGATHDERGGQYSYVIDTTGIPAGTAAIEVSLDDGRSYSVAIELTDPAAKEHGRDAGTAGTGDGEPGDGGPKHSEDAGPGAAGGSGGRH